MDQRTKRNAVNVGVSLVASAVLLRWLDFSASVGVVLFAWLLIAAHAYVAIAKLDLLGDSADG